ncbi:Hypothetical predicted protein [Paramuricea clavata]|uniref:Reverse transcriptase domain-containing protein n=1 Tax=Paramuricea clavata TaxID=317549 RepID=A0A6S7KJQ3_PARCT|nr:Hypothetical predicted protein [Paramuricea clavata]
MIHEMYCISKLNQTDSTKLWKHINELVPNNSKSAPTAIKDGETTLTDAKDLCESFNNYFSTVVYKYLPTSNLDPDLEQLNDFVSSKITDDILLTIPPLTCDEVFQLLNQLDPHKATGLDGLSSKILKMSASVIAEPLTLILNQSITYGYFPMRWKTARVAPVHKSGSRTEKTPVSFGVPQGSILGPLLFILFVNDLPLHSNQSVDLYADDSTLHSSGNSMNQLNCTLSSAMEDIEQWSTFNGMVINGEKSKSMVICTYQKSTKIVSSELHINYNNTVLENVKSKRLLGVIVDNHLC